MALARPRKCWPAVQIRRWLQRGEFQRAFLRHFYSDPERVAPPGTGLIVPADRLVTSAGVRGQVRSLAIALSFWDMHVQRSPVAGTVFSVQSYGDNSSWTGGGSLRFYARNPVRYKNVWWLRPRRQVAVRLITSISARRIETWVCEGEKVERGQRIGRILLGSNVMLELPAATKLLMRTGDRACGGLTAVAEGLVVPWVISSGHPVTWAGAFLRLSASPVWFLMFDLVWRVKNIRIGRLAIGMSIGWIIGFGLILFGFYFGNR